jgi:malate dehydrogenase (oxaloacetate-decarboxylating)
MTDTMLLSGAQRLAQLSPAIKQVKGEGNDAADNDKDEYNGESLLPDFAHAPKVNFEVAVSVAERAVLEGSALVDWFGEASTNDLQDLSDDMKLKVKEMAQKKVWVPVYLEYEYDAEGMTEA